jgi:uncharacterized protein (TIGR02266 family)
MDAFVIKISDLPMSMREHRAFERIPVHLEVRYEDGAALASSIITSISGGGVHIKTSRPLPIGTMVMLEISLEGEAIQPVRMAGRVVWERLLGRDGGMGVAFTEPLPERLRRLLAPVDEKA